MPPTSSILFLCLFYLLLMAEFFVPSAGIIGAAAAIAAVIAIVTSFMSSASAGLTTFSLVVVTTPGVLWAMIHVWPKTAIGRRILNRRPGQITESTAPARTLPDGRPLSDLHERQGIALTDLLPAGLVQIDHYRLDAVSSGVAIDRGTRVTVTKIQAGKIQVRPARENELEPGVRQDEPTPSSPDLLDVDINALEADDLSA